MFSGVKEFSKIKSYIFSMVFILVSRLLTIPFFPTSSLPASNCGFIRATIIPLSEIKEKALGKIKVKEINETSIEIKSNFSWIKDSSKYLILVLSIVITFGFDLIDQSICP